MKRKTCNLEFLETGLVGIGLLLSFVDQEM
jgi:hypothetical protein